MSKEGPLDTLIHTIYETALDPGRWASALQQLAGYLDAAASHFIVWHRQVSAVSFSVLTGAPPEADGSYGAYYAAIDPLRQLAMAQSPGGWLRCNEHFDEKNTTRCRAAVNAGTSRRCTRASGIPEPSASISAAG